MKLISLGVPIMLKITDLNLSIITIGHVQNAGNRLSFYSSYQQILVEIKDSMLSPGTTAFFQP